jgi:predicted MFS family arabinose efflux permease
MLGVYNILQIADQGWFASQTLILGGISLALIAAFVLRQARISNPLMPLRLFRSANVSGANVVQALVVAGMFGLFFMGALYMQRVLGYDPLEVGLAFLPATIAMGTMSLKVSDRVNMRFGPKAVLMPALGALAAALLLMARTPVDASFAADLFAPMVLMGIGAGLAFPALMSLAMSGVEMEDSGLASGLVNTSVQVGGAIGLAVLATLATGRTETLQSNGESGLAALNAGYHLAYLIGAALIGIAIAVAYFYLRSPDRSAMAAAHGDGGGLDPVTAAATEASLSEAA